MTLNHTDLIAALDYDPESGVFMWKQRRRGRNRFKPAGAVVTNGYRHIVIDGIHYAAHRLAWFYVHGEWPKMIDHKNLERDDNRIDNLRIADWSENIHNRRVRSDSKSGLKGVSFHRQSGKWFSRVTRGGVVSHLGYHDTPEAAHAAYASAAVKTFGSFARTA